MWGQPLLFAAGVIEDPEQMAELSRKNILNNHDDDMLV